MLSADLPMPATSQGKQDNVEVVMNVIVDAMNKLGGEQGEVSGGCYYWYGLDKFRVGASKLMTGDACDILKLLAAFGRAGEFKSTQ